MSIARGLGFLAIVLAAVITAAASVWSAVESNDANSTLQHSLLNNQERLQYEQFLQTERLSAYEAFTDASNDVIQVLFFLMQDLHRGLPPTEEQSLVSRVSSDIETKMMNARNAHATVDLVGPRCAAPKQSFHACDVASAADNLYGTLANDVENANGVLSCRTLAPCLQKLRVLTASSVDNAMKIRDTFVSDSALAVHTAPAPNH